MPTKRLGGSIEASPLLNGKQDEMHPTAHSTINPGKLDHARFTEIKSLESDNTNSLRIIIYVIVVIVIGVGLALLVRQWIANSQPAASKNDDTSNVVSTPVVINTALVVNTKGIVDSLATNIGNNSDYVDSALVTLSSNSNNLDGSSLNKIIYTKYNSFSRLIFDLNTEDSKLPKTTISYDSARSYLTVDFGTLETINESLKKNLEIDDLVSEVRFDPTTNTFAVFISEKSKYRVFGEGDNLVIDFKTIADLTADTTTETDTDTSTTPDSTNTITTNTTEKPTAPHYTNSFSQNKQYVSSALTTKTISFNNYYTWDEGTFFEFSWAQEGAIGSEYIPNATAYLDVVDEKNYIVVEIENLERANLSAGLTAEQIQTSSGYTMAGANFVKVELESFTASTGKAIYRIELKKKANFQLLTQEAYGGKTQILSIQIKD